MNSAREQYGRPAVPEDGRYVYFSEGKKGGPPLLHAHVGNGEARGGFCSANASELGGHSTPTFEGARGHAGWCPRLWVLACWLGRACQSAAFSGLYCLARG